MASYELTRAADRDLDEIYLYSFQQFGEKTANCYLLGLHDCFARLADAPDLGRSVERLRRGYFRFEHARHAVFYVMTERGVRIMRVLHVSMDPKRHL